MKIAKDKLQSLFLKLINQKEQISSIMSQQRPTLSSMPKVAKAEKQHQEIYLQPRRGPGRKPRRQQPAAVSKNKQNSQDTYQLQSQQISTQKRSNKKEASVKTKHKTATIADAQPSQDGDYLTTSYLQTNNDFIQTKKSTIVMGKGWRWKQDLHFSAVHKLILNEVQSMDIVCTILPKLTSLEELIVYDTVTCQEKNILQLVNCIPPSINRLCFSCSNEFSMECVSVLKKRQIVNLQVLQYFFDVQRDLRRVDETLYFKEKDRGVRIQPLQISQTLQLITIFPNLRNLWLPIKNYWKQPKAVPFEQLNCLCLGELDEEINQNQNKPDKKLIKSLYKAHSLRYLSLLNVYIEETDFIKLIAQNHELNSLYLECCPTISQQGIRLASRDSKLINFSIKDCPLVTGAFIEGLPFTEIFVMDQTVKINDKPAPLGSFKGLNRLNYLNLYGNLTFNDQQIYELINSSNTLRSLNVGYTSISSKCIEAFKYFFNLECICLDENKLQIPDILQILTNTPKIQKLSICGYNGNGQKGELLIEHLNLIGSCLPQLTHLSIKYCRSLDANIDMERFSNLRFVEVDQQTSTQLVDVFRSKGVAIFIED